MINGHGNNLYEYEGQIRYDFSSNIAYNNQSDTLLAFLKEHISSIKNYPDPEARVLTRQIAEHHHVDPRCILVTNGSAEAFYLIAHLFEGARTAICTPAFAEYEDACKLYRHNCFYTPIKQFADIDFSPYQTVWLGNPNNPDGTLTPQHEIQRQCQKSADTFFVVDYAYLGLTSQKSVIEMVENKPSNLIQIHSLTKLFGIPGIRLGYVIASQEVIARLSEMRLPWSVNSMALDAGSYIMNHYHQLLPNLQELTDASLFLQTQLRQNPFIEVYPSSCNFFLSRLKKGTATWLKDALIHKSGILIRNAANFRDLDDRYFRVAAQSHTSNMAFVNAVNQLLNEL